MHWLSFLLTEIVVNVNRTANHSAVLNTLLTPSSASTCIAWSRLTLRLTRPTFRHPLTSVIQVRSRSVQVDSGNSRWRVDRDHRINQGYHGWGIRHALVLTGFKVCTLKLGHQLIINYIPRVTGSLCGHWRVRLHLLLYRGIIGKGGDSWKMRVRNETTSGCRCGRGLLTQNTKARRIDSCGPTWNQRRYHRWQRLGFRGKVLSNLWRRRNCIARNSVFTLRTTWEGNYGVGIRIKSSILRSVTTVSVVTTTATTTNSITTSIVIDRSIRYLGARVGVSTRSGRN